MTVVKHENRKSEPKFFGSTMACIAYLNKVRKSLSIDPLVKSLDVYITEITADYGDRVITWEVIED